MWAAHYGHDCDGGRGGAIGCMLTFLMFFLGRPTAQNAIEARRRDDGTRDVLLSSLPKTDEELREQFQAVKLATGRIRGSVAVMLDAGNSEKLYLSAATVISTLVWGFGDISAGWLGAAPCVPACTL